MTIISWDGKTLAFDSLETAGGLRMPATADRKAVIKRYPGRGSVIYGATGLAGWLSAWIAWTDAGSISADCPKHSVDPSRSGVIIRIEDGQASFCTPEFPYWLQSGAPDAWGSGCDLAIGAMHEQLATKGEACAFSAAVLACQLNVFCGPPVLVLYAVHPIGFDGALENCACPACRDHFVQG